MSRLVIPAAIVAKYEAAAGVLQREWAARADPAAFDRARAVAARTYPVHTDVDVEASVALARRHDALSGFCYWNAAEALLADPVLAHARYVEGVLAIDTPMVAGGDVRHLQLECQGWLELVDGRTVDTTRFASRTRRPLGRGRARAFYVPVVRLTRGELVGLELPRMMHEPALCLRTLEAVNVVMLSLGAAAGTAPQGLRRALRLFTVSLAVPWLVLRERMAERLAGAETVPAARPPGARCG